MFLFYTFKTIEGTAFFRTRAAIQDSQIFFSKQLSHTAAGGGLFVLVLY